ncbi:MAG: flavodoxin-dependent (E)-4-hydroxy-3-methylbut-2-enyl-diphosphate synthase [Thermoanaerobaculum sp.]
MTTQRKPTVAVRVGTVTVGGGAPVVVQAMTNTDTADAVATARQVLELWEAGAELVRITVNNDQAAQAVPEIRARLDNAGCRVPLVGDFHFNGHLLLTRYPECARVLDKFRINPGNVGRGQRKDENFLTFCRLAKDLGKAIRIGVNAGSLDPDLVVAKMQENTDKNLGLSSDEIISECMLISALQSLELALSSGLGEDRIVISCKISRPPELIRVYRKLSEATRQPLHLGLTEAGMGRRGIVWSAAAMAVLLAEGIGDTIRVSLTPTPGGDRREEVWVACELLQALGVRSFAPTVTACPGCGRTTSTTFQELAQRVDAYLKARLPQWRTLYPGVEELKVAVMGCVVNGPGESKAANIGISLPGTGEAPACPVFVDGKQVATFKGNAEELAQRFLALIDDYVSQRWGGSFSPPKQT